MAVSVGLVPVMGRATSLPAEPVRRQLEALVIDTGDGVDDLARTNGIDPTWAARVATGAITQVDLPHVRQVCEGLRCTPYDLWGPEGARTIAHAYGPDAWPGDPDPLLPVDGIDSGPPISTDWPAPTTAFDGHVLDGPELVQ
jgi:DNA-binding Xre family transcriptional regulator